MLPHYFWLTPKINPAASSESSVHLQSGRRSLLAPQSARHSGIALPPTGLPRSRRRLLPRPLPMREQQLRVRRGWPRPEERSARMGRSLRERRAKREEMGEKEGGAATASPNTCRSEEGARTHPSSGTLSPANWQRWRPRATSCTWWRNLESINNMIEEV